MMRYPAGTERKTMAELCAALGVTVDEARAMITDIAAEHARNTGAPVFIVRDGDVTRL